MSREYGREPARVNVNRRGEGPYPSPDRVHMSRNAGNFARGRVARWLRSGRRALAGLDGGRIGRARLDEQNAFVVGRLRARLAADPEADLGQARDGLAERLLPADADLHEVGIRRREAPLPRDLQLVDAVGEQVDGRPD